MDRLGENDRKYLDMIARSPQEGLALLMDQYTGLIWKITSRYLRNPEDVKECVNETFAHFYFHRDSYDPARSSLPVYLSAIARNLSLMRLRSRDKVVDLPQEDWSLLAAEGPEVTAEDRQVLSAALFALTDQERRVVLLHAVSGMKHREIAQLLELPLATVLSKYRRALKKLRDLLEGDEMR